MQVIISVKTVIIKIFSYIHVNMTFIDVMKRTMFLETLVCKRV